MSLTKMPAGDLAGLFHRFAHKKARTVAGVS